MEYLYFISELVLLFFLSRILSQQLSKVFYHITRNEKMTIYLVAILFFPGVVIHETSHWLMAQLLFVPTGRVEFFPVLRGTELKLGSVAVAKTDPIRRALIGFAPFLFGTSILLILLFFSSQLLFIPERIRGILIGYTVFEIGNTMFSSKKDLEGTFELALFFSVLWIIGFIAGIRIPDAFLYFFEASWLVAFMGKAVFYLLFPLGIDLMLITALWIWANLTT